MWCSLQTVLDTSGGYAFLLTFNPAVRLIHMLSQAVYYRMFVVLHDPCHVQMWSKF